MKNFWEEDDGTALPLEKCVGQVTQKFREGDQVFYLVQFELDNKSYKFPIDEINQGLKDYASLQSGSTGQQSVPPVQANSDYSPSPLEVFSLLAAAQTN